ncbi:hypothetical protein ONZ45_g18476 [Pleurotus djamor]|nr:hypothetical protein ONZ45_g18476 [Pleurotus djamor]
MFIGDMKSNLRTKPTYYPSKKVIAVFFGLALCIVVAALDSVIVATALPTISAAFNAGSVVSWVPSAYLLTATSFQPLYGRFSDIFGRKSTLCLAMAVYMIGSLIAGFSRSIIQLIVFRGVAGAGGGGIVSMAQIVMSDIVSLRDRGKYQGIVGGVVALGYGIGPLIGGALAEKVSWRWCFWVTLPVSLAAIIVVIFVLPLKPVEGNIRSKLKVVDYMGVGLTLLACTLVILPLIWGGVTFSWKSPVVLAPLFSGLLVAIIFCLWEWRGAKLPIVPMYIFKVTTVSGVYISMFLNGFIFFSSLYYLPQYFQVVLGFSPIRAGVFLIPVLTAEYMSHGAQGVVVSRTGRYRAIIYLGFSVWAIGCGCLSTVVQSSPQAVVVVFMLLAGTGAGQTLQTTTVAAQASVPRKDMSVVTAFRNFIRQLGGALALAVGSTIINNSLRASMNALSLPQDTVSAIVDNPSLLSSPPSLNITSETAKYILDKGYTKGFQTVFILNGALAATAAVTSYFMILHTSLTRGDEDQLRMEAKEFLKKHRLDGEKKSAPSSGEGSPRAHEVSTGDVELGQIEHKYKDLQGARR